MKGIVTKSAYDAVLRPLFRTPCSTAHLLHVATSTRIGTRVQLIFVNREHRDGMEMLRRNNGTLGRIVVLTGAGISAESGLATFRGGGLWAEHRIEDVATHDAWVRDPESVWRFYQSRRRGLLEVEANAAHEALVRLEQALAPDRPLPQPVSGFNADWSQHWDSFSHDAFVLITQNVDDLHLRAGSLRLIAMHGQLRLLRCEASGLIVEMMADEHLDPNGFIDSPNCRGEWMRPHVVWFGEQPFGMRAIYDAISCADVFLVVGSSGNVYPAAGLAQEAAACGARTILVNLEAPQNLGSFDEVHIGNATEILPALVDEWIAVL